MSFDSRTGWRLAVLTVAALAAGALALRMMGTDVANVLVPSDRAWTIQPTLPSAAPPVAATPAPSITILNPLSNHAYAGPIAVRASAKHAGQVTYQIGDGPGQLMSLDASTGVWVGGLDTSVLAEGRYNITVQARNDTGDTSSDTAWNVQLSNSGLAPLSPRSARHLFGLIGDNTTSSVLAAERAAGVNAKIIRLSWKDYLPGEHVTDVAYVATKRAEIASLHQAGFSAILDLGLQDTPSWLHQTYPDSYYVNQYGDVYGEPGQADQGDANLIFNSAVRSAAADYLDRAFVDLGTDFGAVRLGGGRWGELTYPPANYKGHTSAYWGFDPSALRLAPTHAWRPGQPHTGAQASVFINWYLDALVDYQNWQIAAVRRAYAGSVMMLYPGWGIRPGQLDEAIQVNLNGSSSGEINGEVEGGFDFARQIAAVTDARVLVTTTWLDADASHDGDSQSRGWSPVKYLASLASAHPLKLRLYGENTGQGSVAALNLAVHQFRQFGLIGMAWFNESEVLGGQYATLADLASSIGSAS